MKRRSLPRVKRIKKPSYSDKVKSNNMMYGPHPHNKKFLVVKGTNHE